MKKIVVREKSRLFQSQGKEPFCFIIIHNKELILQEFFYYLIYAKE